MPANDLLRAIFTQAPDAIVTTDEAGIITGWNLAAERITGWTAAEAKGKPARDHHWPAERAEESEIVEGWSPRKDGRQFWSSGTRRPLLDDDGKTVGFVEIFRDDTLAREERAAAEFRLRFSETIRQHCESSTFLTEAQAMLGRHLGANRVFFAEVDTKTNEYIVRQDWTDGLPSVVGVHQRRNYSDRPLPELLACKALVFCDLEQLAPPGPRREAARAIGAIASIAVPALVDTSLVSLTVVHQSQPRQWTEGEVALVRHVAIIVAVEIRRARAIAALHRSESQLRQLADAMPQMVWSAGPDGTIDYHNRRWYEYTGLPEGTTGAEHRTPLISPDDIDRVAASWRESVSTGVFHEIECRFLRASDQTWRWHLTRAYPTRDENGHVIRWYATSTDIHDQRLALERYRENREQLAIAVEAGAMGTWHMDLATNETTHSDAAKAFYGRGPDDPLSMADCVRAVVPEDRPLVRSAYERALETGHYTAEYRLQRPDGSIRWVAVHGRLVRGPDGKARSFDGVMQDTTERKAAERRREALLAAEQSARVEAERAARMKDEFLATLSHELRTPLNAIVGWSSILQRMAGPTMPEELVNGLEIIARSARAQSQIIDDTLDMSRIVAGNLRLDIKVVDVHAVVRAGVDTVKAAASAKGISFHVVFDTSVGAIAGDASRLQQVLWNLLSNAVKFTAPGGRVELIAERRGSHIELRVADNGEGISPEFLPFVFDRFRQADGSTTRRHGGLGLGLAIVKQLVELHGGTVSVHSAGLGKGATFVVSLPLTPVLVARDTPVPVRPMEPSPLRGVIVVLVDDEPDGRAAVGKLLASEGAEVRSASSAEEALALFADAPPRRPPQRSRDAGRRRL